MAANVTFWYEKGYHIHHSMEPLQIRPIILKWSIEHVEYHCSVKQNLSKSITRSTGSTLYSEN